MTQQKITAPPDERATRKAARELIGRVVREIEQLQGRLLRLAALSNSVREKSDRLRYLSENEPGRRGWAESVQTTLDTLSDERAAYLAGVDENRKKVSQLGQEFFALKPARPEVERMEAELKRLELAGND